MPRGCVNSIRLWPLRLDDHSGALIGAGGTRRSDWPARAERSIARVQGHLPLCRLRTPPVTYNEPTARVSLSEVVR